MQQAGMVHRAGQIAERRFQHFARLKRAGARCGLAGTRVPHLPGCAIEDGLDEDGAQVEVVRMRAVRDAHGVGEGVVPRVLVVDRIHAGDSGTAAPRLVPAPPL